MDIVLSEDQRDILCYGLEHRTKSLRQKVKEAEEDGRGGRREQLRAWLSANTALHQLVRVAQSVKLTFHEDQDAPERDLPAPGS